jgi:hypothetical protein
MPLMMPSTAWSMVASAKMMLAALPPSSSVSLFAAAGGARWMSLPTPVLPVKAILSTARMVDERRARGTRTGDDVDDAIGQFGFLDELGEQQR